LLRRDSTQKHQREKKRIWIIILLSHFSHISNYKIQQFYYLLPFSIKKETQFLISYSSFGVEGGLFFLLPRALSLDRRVPLRGPEDLSTTGAGASTTASPAA